jgi:hypothetical protein
MTKHARWLRGCRKPHALVMAAVLGGGLMAPLAAMAGNAGMTWAKTLHDAGNGIDRISCTGCDAYRGDTQCTEKRPVLCVKLDSSPRPNYDVPDKAGGSRAPEFYEGWLGGQVAATVPVLGSQLTSAAAGDALCAAKFGDGWRMAEFHDGRYMNGMDRNKHYGDDANWGSASPWIDASAFHGGWSLWAFGNLRDDTRFWVHINDQPANCWN